MGRTRRQGIDAPTCGECGHTPHPERRRLALAKLTAVFPIELALHLLVLWLHPPLLATAALLAVTTTALVIWVVEPSAMRLLARWLNAPAARAQDHLLRAESLWRVRVTLRDTPGELEAVAAAIAHLGASVLDLSVHPLARGVRDEIIVSAPPDVTREHLVRAVSLEGAADVRVWPTTPMALVDATTRALNAAVRVALSPESLATTLAELLEAEVVESPSGTLAGPGPSAGPSAGPGDGQLPGPADPRLLRVPTPWTGLLVFRRPEEPFTPAEVARAHRLAQIAETAHGRADATSPTRPA